MKLWNVCESFVSKQWFRAHIKLPKSHEFINKSLCHNCFKIFRNFNGPPLCEPMNQCQFDDRSVLSAFTLFWPAGATSVLFQVLWNSESYFKALHIKRIIFQSSTDSIYCKALFFPMSSDWLLHMSFSLSRLKLVIVKFQRKKRFIVSCQ